MQKRVKQTIGLALGGGGARGFAHIPMLEVFDECGIQPTVISGTSIGSVMGALYASGLSGQEIRELISSRFFNKSDSFADLLRKKDAFKSLTFFDLAWKRSGILRGDKVIQFLYDQMKADRFEDLRIPLKIVATDFWTGEQVILDKGPLLPAIKASMGLPGIFMPVKLDGRVLIDGGTTNPVPFDLLINECDVVIAIDVLGTRKPGKNSEPGAFEAIISTFDILQASIVRQKLEQYRPTHYLHPDILNTDVLGFDGYEDVYRQAGGSVKELRSILRAL